MFQQKEKKQRKFHLDSLRISYQGQVRKLTLQDVLYVRTVLKMGFEKNRGTGARHARWHYV